MDHLARRQLELERSKSSSRTDGPAEVIRLIHVPAVAALICKFTPRVARWRQFIAHWAAPPAPRWEWGSKLASVIFLYTSSSRCGSSDDAFKIFSEGSPFDGLFRFITPDTLHRAQVAEPTWGVYKCVIEL